MSSVSGIHEELERQFSIDMSNRADAPPSIL